MQPETDGLVWLIACIYSLEIWKQFRASSAASQEKFLSPENPQE
jgi:hypothetical protein